MAVKVIIGNPNTESGTVQHGEGETLEINNGHLIVLAGGSMKRIAIYAPGKWNSAEVIK
jgi:hypothetical protein